MAALALVADVKSLYSPSMALARDVEVQSCIEAATDLLESASGYRLRLASRSIVFDGARADGEKSDTLYLPRRYPSVVHVPASGVPVAVTENGGALTVASGYSTSVGVLLDGEGLNARGTVRLRRYGGPWSEGMNNVIATFFAGYDISAAVPGSSPAVNRPPPWDLRHLVREIAWLIFSSPAWLGKANETKAGSSVAWEKSLTPLSRATYERLLAESW